MRREVPQDVDVGLDEAEVDPHRIDEQDLAEHAVGDELADAQNRRGVAVGVVGHQHEIAHPRLVDHDLGRRIVVGQRLLDQHVLARAQRRQARSRCAYAPASRPPPPRRRRAQAAARPRSRPRPCCAARSRYVRGPDPDRTRRRDPNQDSIRNFGRGSAPSTRRRPQQCPGSQMSPHRSVLNAAFACSAPAPGLSRFTRSIHWIMPERACQIGLLIESKPLRRAGRYGPVVKIGSTQ